ncbi:MAG: hypothetical protein ABIY71_12290, partial [Flavobacteriales bacterium]
MRKPVKKPTYVGLFELMDERCLLALIRKANVYAMSSSVVELQERLDAGETLREIAPGAWQPEGNYLSGGYGFDARALPKGRFEVRFSVGRPR